MMVQMENDPKMASKPEAVREKIVLGKLNKFYSENCLLQQEFVKDGSMSVEKYIESSAKALGGKVTFKDAVRFEKGRGHREEAGELRRGDRLHGEGQRLIIKTAQERVRKHPLRLLLLDAAGPRARPPHLRRTSVLRSKTLGRPGLRLADQNQIRGPAGPEALWGGRSRRTSPRRLPPW